MEGLTNVHCRMVSTEMFINIYLVIKLTSLINVVQVIPIVIVQVQLLF